MKTKPWIWILCLLACCSCMPPSKGVKEAEGHEFIKRIITKEKKRACVSLKIGLYTFKKRKEKGGRVAFTCNAWQAEGK